MHMHMHMHIHMHMQVQAMMTTHARWLRSFRQELGPRPGSKVGEAWA